MSKYKFSREQLKFIEDKKGIRGFLMKALKYIFFSILLALCYYLVFALLFDTSKEKKLIRENRLLIEEYGKVSEKMEVLDRVISGLRKRDENIYTQIFRSPPTGIFFEENSDAIYNRIDSLNNTELVRFSHEKSEYMLNAVQDQNIKLKAIVNMLNASDNGSYMPSILPIRELLVSQTGAGVGMKIHPFYKTTYFHQGMDLLASIGTKVVATANGRVLKVSTTSKGIGLSVIIEHLHGYKTVYSHLNSISVKIGDVVKQGSVIGEVGNSGLSFAPHLHYEVLLNDEPQNPVNYFFADLTPLRCREMDIISANSGQSLD